MEKNIFNASWQMHYLIIVNITPCINDKQYIMLTTACKNEKTSYDHPTLKQLILISLVIMAKHRINLCVS
jgi:hypothetical protein